MPEIVDNVEYLSKTIGPRPAGTEEEQQAALYIAEQLQKDAGLPATVEDFGGVFDSELTGIICGAAALVALVLGIAVPVLGIPSIILALLAAGLFAAESFGVPVLARFFGRGVSQNVVAKYDPGISATQQKRRRKVILVANYDSGKVCNEFSGPLANFMPYAKQASMIGMCLLALSLIFRNVFLLNSTGFVHGLFTVLAVLGGLLSLIPLAIGALHKAAPYNEGANCNASGVAVMLEVARRIGNGRVSEAELAQRQAVVHGEAAARDAGLVPVGAEIVYESQKLQAPDVAPMTEAARLASAKAAIAALTGKPVPGAAVVSDIASNLVNVKDRPVPVPTEEETHEWRAETREALSGEDGWTKTDDAQAEAVDQAEQAEPSEQASAPGAEAEAEVSTEFAAGEGAQAGEAEQAAHAEVEPELLTGMAAGSAAAFSSLSSAEAPAWFKSAQAKAKKNLEEAGVSAEAEEPQIKRSRFAEAEEARLAAEEAAQAAEAAARAPKVNFAWQQAAEDSAAEEGSAENDSVATVADNEVVAEAAPANALEDASFASSPAANAPETQEASGEEASGQQESSTLDAAPAEALGAFSSIETDAVPDVAADAASFAPNVSFLDAFGDGEAWELEEAVTPASQTAAAESAAQVGDSLQDEAPAAPSEEPVAGSVVSANDGAPSDEAVLATDEVTTATDEAAPEEPLIKRSRYAEAFEAAEAATAAAQAAQQEPELNIDLGLEEKDGKAAVLDALESGVLPFADAAPVQEAIASNAITDSSTGLYGVDLTTSLDAIAQPLTNEGEVQDTSRTDMRKQRAPLAEATVSGQAAAAKSLLTNLPSIDVSGSAAPAIAAETLPVVEVATTDRSSLRAQLPSLSGLIGKPVKAEESSDASVVNTAGSFVAASATGTFAPIGDELVQDVAPDEIYVDDADDSAYGDTYTESGAFAGPDYVSMPKSRIRKFFDRFGHKDKADEETPQEWLNVDDSFDARTVGAERGGWESFRDDQVASAAAAASAGASATEAPSVPPVETAATEAVAAPADEAAAFRAISPEAAIAPDAEASITQVMAPVATVSDNVAKAAQPAIEEPTTVFAPSYASQSEAAAAAEANAASADEAAAADQTIPFTPVPYDPEATQAIDPIVDYEDQPTAIDMFNNDAFGQPFDDFYDDDADYYAGEDGYAGDIGQDAYDDFLNGDDKPKKKRGWFGGAFSDLLQKVQAGNAGEEPQAADEVEQANDAPSDTLNDAEGASAEGSSTEDEVSAAQNTQVEAQIDEEIQKIHQFRNPDVNTEVWFVGLGSELSGHAGIRAFLDEHADELRGAIVVDLTSMGGGELSLIQQEGGLKTVQVSSRMKRYMTKVAKATGISAGLADLKWDDSAASVSMKRGVQGMHLVGMDGVAPAGFGRADDISENVEEDTLLANADFVMELVKNI